VREPDRERRLVLVGIAVGILVLIFIADCIPWALARLTFGLRVKVLVLAGIDPKVVGRYLRRRARGAAATRTQGPRGDET
jgi:hypothetical protein